MNYRHFLLAPFLLLPLATSLASEPSLSSDDLTEMLTELRAGRTSDVGVELGNHLEAWIGDFRGLRIYRRDGDNVETLARLPPTHRTPKRASYIAPWLELVEESKDDPSHPEKKTWLTQYNLSDPRHPTIGASVELTGRMLDYLTSPQLWLIATIETSGRADHKAVLHFIQKQGDTASEITTETAADSLLGNERALFLFDLAKKNDRRMYLVMVTQLGSAESEILPATTTFTPFECRFANGKLSLKQLPNLNFDGVVEDLDSVKIAGGKLSATTKVVKIQRTEDTKTIEKRLAPDPDGK